MVCTALVSASSGPGLSPEARDIASCTARHFILIVPVSTLVYKWVPAKLMLGVTPQWTNIPCRGKGGGVEMLLVASCSGNRDKLWPDGPLGSYADFTSCYILSCYFCHCHDYINSLPRHEDETNSK